MKIFKLFSKKNQMPDFTVDILKFKSFTNNCDKIETVVLGSSHGRDAFLPDNNCFNLANSSQDLYRASKVYEYIINNCTSSSVKNIILFWSVFHPGLQLEKTQEYIKCIPYKALYGIEYAMPLPIDDSSILKHIHKQSKIIPDQEYRGESFYNVTHIDITQELVAKHIKNTKRNNNQIQYLENMATLAAQHGHKLYIVLPPYRQDYLDCLPSDQEIYFELFAFLQKNPDVQLLNFQRDPDFKSTDFDSADHCNKTGARKLTNKIMQHL